MGSSLGRKHRVQGLSQGLGLATWSWACHSQGARVGLTSAFDALPPPAAPGTGGLKFNIQKRPFAVTSQNFSSASEGQHSGFGPQPNPEKAQNHR